MRERLRSGLLGCLLACLGAAGCTSTAVKPADQPLDLASLGVFFVGGRAVDAPYSDRRGAAFPTSGRSVVTGQARITMLRPARVSGAAIVLIPGFGLGSSIYLSTPDGREGWAQELVRSGHPVYVVDLPGRGSSGFAIDAVNGCLSGTSTPSCSPPTTLLGRTSLEQPWNTWGFGPKYRERYPDSRFPATQDDELYAGQFGAAFEVFLDDGGEGPAVAGSEEKRALQLLLERIGPAVLVMHSAAGAPGFAVARDSPAQVRALVAVETVACPQGGRGTPFEGIPFYGLWGDYIDLRVAGGHARRRTSCRAFAAAQSAAGAAVEFVSLPDDRGIRGNSHLMMQDDNNRELARMISAWLDARGIR